MPRQSPYHNAITEMVANLVSRGADIALEKDATGYRLTSEGGARNLSLVYSAREMLIYLTGYSQGREHEALEQMAGSSGTDIPPAPADSEAPGVKHG